MPADFISLEQPSSRQHKYQIQTSKDKLGFVKDMLRFETIMIVGASVQILFMLVLPLRVAVAPAILLGIYRLITTSLQLAKVIPNEYEENIIRTKVSAQFPDPSTGSFGHEPAAQPVVVFLLGVRFNHPLGLLSPGAQDIVTHFLAMNKNLAQHADEFGMLGVSTWRGSEFGDNNCILSIFYFKDVEGVHDFAHSDVHMRGWNWYNKAKLPHIGIMHESFSVPAGAYESIYKNFPPFLMGASTVKVENKETGEPEWVRPIVSAEKGVLKTQLGRMGRSKGLEHENYDFAKEGAV